MIYLNKDILKCTSLFKELCFIDVLCAVRFSLPPPCPRVLRTSRGAHPVLLAPLEPVPSGGQLPSDFCLWRVKGEQY